MGITFGFSLLTKKKEGSFYPQGSLADMQKQVPSLVRLNRYCLVNKDRLKYVIGKILFFTDGMFVPIKGRIKYEL